MSELSQLSPATRLPHLFVIGDSISLHYGPYLQRFLAGRVTYDRKRDEPAPGAAGVSGAATSVAPAAPVAPAVPASPASLDYPLGPFGENAGDSGLVLAYLRARGAGLRNRAADVNPDATADVALNPAPDLPADLVLLNCGLHDLKVDKADGGRRVALDEYRANLAAIIELALEIPLALVWVSTTPVDDETHAAHGAGLGFSRYQADVESYNEVAGELMRAAGVPIIDLHDFTSSLMGGEPSSVYADHVHFAEPLRRAQAEFLAGRLLALLEA